VSCMFVKDLQVYVTSQYARYCSVSWSMLQLCPHFEIINLFANQMCCPVLLMQHMAGFDVLNGCYKLCT